MVDITSTELHEPVSMIDQGLMTLSIFFLSDKNYVPSNIFGHIYDLWLKVSGG